MKSDLHHLKPTDATVNSNRGSLDFDEGGRPEGEAPDTFLDSDSFEPRDPVKGDVARALFYIDLRYEGTGGEPDLVLVTGSTGRGTTLGRLCTLLEWHIADPVTAQEIQINDGIEALQGNRNLFVDQPDLANAIYGPRCGIDAGTDIDTEGFSSLIETRGAGDAGPVRTRTGSLRVATWNIENFWHEPGVALWGDSIIRNEADYDAIREIRDLLAADIIGLQEIGSPEALRTLFPAADWQMVFSKRFDDDRAADPEGRGIYTALAIRRDAATVIGTERIELDILHTNGFALREGTAALVEIDGERLWVASVHLKSFCFTDNDLTGSDDCRTLARQIPILEDWIDQKAGEGHHVLLLGDFNRQLDRGSDIVRQDLDDGDPVDIFKVPHRQPLICRAFRPDPRVSIDYVLMDEALFDMAIVPDIPKLDFANEQISDHCPVFVDLKLGS